MEVRMIGTELFEVVRVDEHTYNELRRRAMVRVGAGLESVYNKPSEIKKAILADWLLWARDTAEVAMIGVDNGNCFMFTIVGIANDRPIKITKAHNYIYEIKRAV